MGPNATIWFPNNAEGEYTQTGVLSIVDPSGVFLVDPSVTQLVDTGVTFTPIPLTTWSINDTA